MSLNKIIDSDITQYGVQSAPDKLTGTAAQNKAVFDNLFTSNNASVRKRFNDLIDALESTSGTTGAAQIGATVTGVEGANVQVILEALKTLASSVDGSAVKVTQQSLTEEQKTIARNNIGVAGSQVSVNSVNGQTGAVTITKNDVSLGNCDNTSDANKPVSTAQQTAINAVTQKVITLSLPTASWVANTGYHTQDITSQITEATADTKVDLQTDITSLTRLIEDGCAALYVVNNNGTLTAYAVSEKPSADISIQATYYEVEVEE